LKLALFDFLCEFPLSAEHTIEEAWNRALILRVFHLRERLGEYQALSSSPNRHTACSQNFDLLAPQR